VGGLQTYDDPINYKNSGSSLTVAKRVIARARLSHWY